MPAAHLNAPSPHANLQKIEAGAVFHDSIREEDRKYANYGCSYSMVPYTMQDDYDRSRVPRQFKTAVLENRILRAEFLAEYGGRLWSLIHKPLNRELLYVNPVFQPGNLALRNAWFSGGIEWNMGMPAHNPFTCSQPFFGVLQDPKRGPVLRMWEWEKLRCAPYQVDFWLPEDSPVLYVRTRLTNPNPETRPAYWFSNIAVPLTDDVRVIVPADMAYSSGYVVGQYALCPVPVPIDSRGLDNSYPVRLQHACDMFYRVNVPEQQPWMTALNKEGRGLFQASTGRLKGRKMFVWGTSPGGERWQEFLSEPGHPYLEIQAGYGRTQVECVPLEANGTADWLEIYGLMQADPTEVHGENWGAARDAVQGGIGRIVSHAALQEELACSAEMAGRSPDEIVLQGSGWGAVERKRRQLCGAPPLADEAVAFGDSTIGLEERKWAELLDKGVMVPDPDQTTPGGYLAQQEWITLLQDSMTRPLGDNWLSRLQLGLLLFASDRFEEAGEQWRRSAEHKPNRFAWRNLAALALRSGDKCKAARCYGRAWDLDKSDFRIAIDYLNLLLDNGTAAELDAVFDTIPEELAHHPRILVAKTKHCFNQGQYAAAEELLLQIELPDLREGDTALTDIWFSIQARRLAAERCMDCTSEFVGKMRKELVPPSRLDFRMA